MRKLTLFILTLMSCSLFVKAQLTYQPDKISRENVSLYSANDSSIESNLEIVDTKVLYDKHHSFLGSYDDWTGKNKYIWVRFNKSAQEEFTNYIQQSVKHKENAQKVSFLIHFFVLKQYLFFNPKGCYFRFEYELYYIKDNKRYSYTIKDSVKIKNVKKTSEVTDQIKLSIKRLLEGLTIDDFVAET